MVDNERILKPMTVGDVLDYSVAVFKRNIKNLTTITLFLYIPFILLEAFISSKVLGDTVSIYTKLFEEALKNNGDLYSSSSALDQFSSSSLLVSILSNLLSLLTLAYSLTIKMVFHGCIIKIIYDDIVKNKTQQPFKELFKFSWSRMPNMIGNATLYSLIVYGAYTGAVIAAGIVCGIPLAVVIWLYTSGTINIAFTVILSVLLVLIGIAVVLAGFLYFKVRLLFGTQAVIIENRSATDSISRSFELTKKDILHCGLSYILGMALFFIFGNVLSAGALVALVVSKGLFMLLYTVLQVLGAFVYPFAMTVFTVIFINQKMKKEGLDLEVKVDMLIEQQQQKENITGGENADV